MTKVEVGCLHCQSLFLWLVDEVEIQGETVQFLACFECQRGYTKCGIEMELIQ